MQWRVCETHITNGRDHFFWWSRADREKHFIIYSFKLLSVFHNVLMNHVMTYPDPEVEDWTWSKGSTGRTLQWTLMFPLNSCSKTKNDNEAQILREMLLLFMNLHVTLWHLTLNICPHHQCVMEFFPPLPLHPAPLLLLLQRALQRFNLSLQVWARRAERQQIGRRIFNIIKPSLCPFWGNKQTRSTVKTLHWLHPHCIRHSVPLGQIYKVNEWL